MGSRDRVRAHDQWQESKVDRAMQAVQEEEQAHSWGLVHAISGGQFRGDIGDLTSPRLKGLLPS